MNSPVIISPRTLDYRIDAAGKGLMFCQARVTFCRTVNKPQDHAELSVTKFENELREMLLGAARCG